MCDCATAIEDDDIRPVNPQPNYSSFNRFGWLPYVGASVILVTIIHMLYKNNDKMADKLSGGAGTLNALSSIGNGLKDLGSLGLNGIKNLASFVNFGTLRNLTNLGSMGGNWNLGSWSRSGSASTSTSTTGSGERSWGMSALPRGGRSESSTGSGGGSSAAVITTGSGGEGCSLPRPGSGRWSGSRGSSTEAVTTERGGGRWSLPKPYRSRSSSTVGAVESPTATAGMKDLTRTSVATESGGKPEFWEKPAYNPEPVARSDKIRSWGAFGSKTSESSAEGLAGPSSTSDNGTKDERIWGRLLNDPDSSKSPHPDTTTEFSEGSRATDHVRSREKQESKKGSTVDSWRNSESPRALVHDNWRDENKNRMSGSRTAWNTKSSTTKSRERIKGEMYDAPKSREAKPDINSNDWRDNKRSVIESSGGTSLNGKGKTSDDPTSSSSRFQAEYDRTGEDASRDKRGSESTHVTLEYPEKKRAGNRHDYKSSHNHGRHSNVNGHYRRNKQYSKRSLVPSRKRSHAAIQLSPGSSFSLLQKELDSSTEWISTPREGYRYLSGGKWVEY